MSRPTTVNIYLDGTLGDFVAERTGDRGDYDDVGGYIRDLIRRDKERMEGDDFERVKADLEEAFDAPDDTFRAITAQDVFARNAG